MLKEIEILLRYPVHGYTLLVPVMNLEEFIVEKHWGDIKELLALAEEVCS